MIELNSYWITICCSPFQIKKITWLANFRYWMDDS